MNKFYSILAELFLFLMIGFSIYAIVMLGVPESLGYSVAGFCGFMISVIHMNRNKAKNSR